MRKGRCFVITDIRPELYSNVKGGGLGGSTPCSCVHLGLIVFCDTSADAEPEEIQVLVTRALPQPQACVLDQYLFHFIAGWKHQEESWGILVDQLSLPSLCLQLWVMKENQVWWPLFCLLQCVRGEGKFLLPILLSFAWLLYWRSYFESSFLTLSK